MYSSHAYIGHEILYNAVSSILLKLPQAQSRLQGLQRSLAERGVCDLDSESISVAATATLTRYQEQMEMLYLCIQRRQEEITNKASTLILGDALGVRICF